MSENVPMRQTAEKKLGGASKMTTEEISLTHMKILGFIPTSREERLELMQKMKIDIKKAKELLEAFEKLERI